MTQALFSRILLVIGVAALAVGLVACGGGSGTNPTPTQGSSAASTIAPATSGEILVNLLDKGGDRFDSNTFNFKVGQKVTLRLKSESQFHTFTINNMPTQEGKPINAFVNAGETVVIEFTPTQAGTFNLVCTPHQTLGMTGKVTITQ